MQTIVVGGGVSGLTSGICLLEAGFSVHLITREMPAQTTSAAAGAIWHPLSTVGDERMLRWARETGARFQQLVEESGSGVAVLPLHEPIPADVDESMWRSLLTDWRTLFPDLAPMPAEALPVGYTKGVQYHTYIIETPVYLNYLLDRFRQLGGVVETGEVVDLDALITPQQLVINCTGAWAGKLTGDRHVYPIRGQVVRLAPQPQQRHGFHVSGGPLDVTYIFPRGNDCILGGTYEAGVWSREPEPATSEQIWQRCLQVEPSLAQAEVLDVRVGLRPGRHRVRLELETRPNGSVIHNYGHGGIGFTLSWGCAADAAHLAQQQAGAL